MFRTLVPVQIVVLLLSGAGCTDPSYRGEKAVPNDAGALPDEARLGPNVDAAVPGNASLPDTKPVQGDGGGTAANPTATPDAATQTACIVGVSRIGECALN